MQRDVQPSAVAYDGGEPQWKPIDGTPLSYAPNTPAPVIRVDPKSYYMVQNGVWFSATAPPGPFVVATAVPAVIYSIPASSPVHYVTYVRVYSSTPTTVFVGYTPGYYGTVMSTDGVVVYGTGYVYPPYVGPYYYYPPPYYTYGYGAGFATGFFIGFAFSGGWHSPCCYGGGGGVYISHHNNINVNNSYNRWGGKSTSVSGPGGRNAKATQVGQTTLAKGSGSNNVYAGRDGNVYRRDDSGSWQQHGGKGEGWSDVGGEPAAAATCRRHARPAAAASGRREHQFARSATPGARPRRAAHAAGPATERRLPRRGRGPRRRRGSRRRRAPLAMNITSVIVHAMPHRLEELRARLAELPGVEIHAATPEGRFIVTVEDTPHASAADTVIALHRLEGVLAAAMVYQYSDEGANP